MPTVTLTFSQPIQDSVSIGDIIYAVPNTATQAEFTTGQQSDILFIGNALSVNRSTNVITVNSNLTNAQVAALGNVFIMFAKDNQSNLSSILGYYAKIRFRNSSTDYAELFSTGVDMFISSK